jgi:hypothetical protein
LRKLLSTIVLLVGALNGCGAGSGKPAGGLLVLADAVTGEHFSLSIVNGGATLSAMGGAGTVSAPELTDSVTGESYRLAVTQSALTLVLNTAPGAPQINLIDTVTANAYVLKVVSGALTLSRI